MSDLGDHVCIVDIAAGVALANVGLGIGIELQYSRSHHPRLQQHSWILYSDLIVQGVSLAPQFLDRVHVVGVKISAFVEPGGIVEPNRVNHESIALPMTDGISVEGHVLGPHRIVLASVRWNDAKIIRLCTGSGGRIKEDHLVGRLNDLRGGPHAWHAVRLTLKDWIHGIRVSIQVLNPIPELRLIEGPVGIDSPRELSVDGLVRLFATPSLVRSTPAGCDIRCDIAVVLRCAGYPAASAVPHTAQGGMAIRRARS